MRICRVPDSTGQLAASGPPPCAAEPSRGQGDDGQPRSSIVVIVATDAPLLPHQLSRLARRVPMGLGHLGSWASNFSGDLFLAFSTANHNASQSDTATIATWPNERMDPLFRAVIEATEEAVVNAMLAAETMVGANGVRVTGLPGSLVVDALKKAGRMQ